MKYLMLIRAGLWRKKTRTILTALSIIVAFLLFGILEGVNQGMNSVYENVRVERLFVENRANMSDGLPIGYLSRIKSVPGVRSVTHWTYFGGFYQEARNPVPVFPTDIEAQFAVYPKLRIPAEQLQRMLATKTGMIVGKETAAKYNWKVGDKIPLRTSVWARKDGGSSYELDVVGIVDASAYGEAAGFPSTYMSFEYFDDTRAFSNGMVHYYVANIDDVLRSTEIAEKIDALFTNSSYETKTQSEQAFSQGRVRQLGDINSIANSIVGAVLFTLLFLTGNTMMQSVRERIPELAVLKALGFSNAKVMTLVLLESLVLCVLASLVGLLIASVAFRGLERLFGDVPLPTIVVLGGVGMAIALALVSGFPPAWRAARLNIVDALAVR